MLDPIKKDGAEFKCFDALEVLVEGVFHASHSLKQPLHAYQPSAGDSWGSGDVPAAHSHLAAGSVQLLGTSSGDKELIKELSIHQMFADTGALDIIAVVL